MTELVLGDEALIEQVLADARDEGLWSAADRGGLGEPFQVSAFGEQREEDKIHPALGAGPGVQGELVAAMRTGKRGRAPERSGRGDHTARSAWSGNDSGSLPVGQARCKVSVRLSGPGSSHNREAGHRRPMPIQTLLIDDDPDLSVMLRTLLKGQDFDIRAVFNGKEGVDACREMNPDVIILDLLMPEMDGWQVCEQIREFSAVPILILSALGAPGSVAR